MLAASAPAKAEDLPRMIPRLLEQAGWLRAHYPGEPESAKAEWTRERHEPSAAAHALLGTSLQVTVLARDWREAYALTDGKALVFDRVRLIRSSRMAVTRLSMGGGRLLPYVELSAGQWRADPELMPYLHSEYELAGQWAAGFEMHVAPRCAFAWDVEHTTMYRDARDPQNLPVTSIVASFAALRAEF